MEQFKTISKKELPALLKKSEQHANEWCYERSKYSNSYQHQIEKGYLSMSVSSKSVKRAVKILEQVLLRCFDAGFALTVERDRYSMPASALLTDDEVVSFRIREKQTIRTDTKDGYRSRILVPSGRLELDLYAGDFYWKPSKYYEDTERTKLEDKIDGIVPYLKSAVQELKRIHLEEEKRQREKDEEIRKQREEQQKLNARANLLKSILKDITLYEKARVIKNYCDIVEPLVKSDTYRKKIELARKYADWINPLVDYSDDLEQVFSRIEF